MLSTLACLLIISFAKYTIAFVLFQCSIDKKLGLFSVEELGASPLAAYEGCKLEPSPPYVKPHEIWVQVILYNVNIFSVQIAKFCSDCIILMMCFSWCYWT
jgi:hypothetical protein